MDIATKPKTQNTKNPFSKFTREQDGYALAMTLIALPLVVGLSAFVIDGSRVANLHTDVQNAVDAMALAGARELDGEDDAIERAEAAISAMSGNEVWFGDNGNAIGMGSKTKITYTTTDGAQSDVTVTFLGAIPDSDDTAIGDGACDPSSINESSCEVKGNTLAQRSNNAGYVRVKAVPRDLRTIFRLPGLGNDTVSVSAEAVATYSATVCDVTPIFICNPFESFSGNPLANGFSFAKNFGLGQLYGRQLLLKFNKTWKAGPGNYGYLKVENAGYDGLAKAVGSTAGSCVRKSGMKVETTYNVGSVNTALNTRFGFYASWGTFSASNTDYPSDENVRSGQSQGYGESRGRYSRCTPDCAYYSPEDNWYYYDALGFPDGEYNYYFNGGKIASSSSWDIDTYWDITHSDYSYAPRRSRYRAPNLPVTIPRSFPGLSDGVTPSRYDVYKYEIVNNLVGNASPNGETGHSLCVVPSNPPVPDRRKIFTAVINCVEHKNDIKNGNEVPAEAFASVFLTRPATGSGYYRKISLEVTDVAGSEGLGTADTNFREEAELVR